MPISAQILILMASIGMAILTALSVYQSSILIDTKSCRFTEYEEDLVTASYVIVGIVAVSFVFMCICVRRQPVVAASLMIIILALTTYIASVLFDVASKCSNDDPQSGSYVVATLLLAFSVFAFSVMMAFAWKKRETVIKSLPSLPSYMPLFSNYNDEMDDARALSSSAASSLFRDELGELLRETD